MECLLRHTHDALVCTSFGKDPAGILTMWEKTPEQKELQQTPRAGSEHGPVDRGHNPFQHPEDLACLSHCDKAGFGGLEAQGDHFWKYKL